MVIIIASFNSILPLLVCISLGATLSVSSQRHIEYILDLNRTTAFSHLVSTKSIARFYGLMGQNTHLKGKIFVFLYVFKIIFSGHKIVVALPPNAPRGYGPGGRGYLSPKFSP